MPPKCRLLSSDVLRRYYLRSIHMAADAAAGAFSRHAISEYFAFDKAAGGPRLLHWPSARATIRAAESMGGASIDDAITLHATMHAAISTSLATPSYFSAPDATHFISFSHVDDC